MYKLLLVVTLLLAHWQTGFASELTSLQSKQTLRVVADHWPGDTNADGTGAYYDLLRLVFEPLGYRISHKVLPMKRAIATMNHGVEADILLADWSAAHLAQGKQYQMDKIVVPQYPISQEYVLAIFAPGSTLSWRDVLLDRNMRVAWVKGYNYHMHLGLEHHRITRITNSGQGIKMLHKQHLDCFFDDKTEIDQVLGQGEFKDTVMRQEVVMKRKLYPIFHNNALGQKLAKQYDKRISKLMASGDIYPFYQRYGKDYSEIISPEIDPSFHQ